MKITNHDHDKYITTLEFNKLTTENFKARLAQANLVTKTDFDDKLQNLNRKVTSYKTEHLIGENELKKLQKFDAAYFRGKNYFGDDGRQNCLVYQPTEKYFKRIVMVLVLLTLFHRGKLKDCLINQINHLIKLLLQN